MNVDVLYFAAARDIAGRSRETLELPQSVATVAEFLAWLVSRYPDLQPYVQSLRVARNETFAEDEEPICANDVLAIIPPVAGG